MSKVINKEAVVERIASKRSVTKVEAGKQLDGVIETLEELVSELEVGDKIQLVGKLTFEKAVRAERVGRNPKTKEEITIPATNVVKIKAGKDFKEAVK